MYGLKITERMPLKKTGILALASSVLLAGSLMVEAAPLEGYTQGLPKGGMHTVRLTPKSLATGSQDETVLLPQAKGVVIISEPSEVRSSGATADGVDVRSDVIPSGVASAAQKYIGKPVSLASLDRMTRDMVLAFRSAGMPVVNVVVPPQDITAGTVQIIAVVGHMGNLSVSGNAKDPQAMSADFPLQSGDVVEEGAVLDYLRWKSRRAHRNVTAIYAPGSKFSETDITLEVNETKPWSVFTGIDNTGNSSVGDYRMFGGIVIGDLWGLDHELAYQFTSSEEGLDALGAHVLSYTLPVPFLARTDLSLIASYVQSESAAVGTQKGESTQLSANFISQLPRFMGTSFDLRYGFEYKKSDNDLEFGGTTVSTSSTEIGQFYAQILGQKNWSWGLTNVNAGIWISPGGMFNNNVDAAFRIARAGTQADYAILRAGFEQIINLPKNFMLNIDIEAQLASGRLLASEMMYLGGMRTIRGFGENVAKGDEGVMARVELLSPGISILGRQFEGARDQLRALAFVDAGSVSNNGTMVAGDDNASIIGAGVGLKYQVSNHFDAEVTYGWNVYDESNVETDDGALNFRAVFRY